MERTVPGVAVLAVVAALVLAPVGAVAAGDALAATSSPTDDASDGVAPGERLSGVVAVGQSELETEVDARAYGLALARAASDGGRAEVVADRVDAVRERIDALERRKAALQRARENGSLGEGAFRARMAGVAAELAGAERLANRSASAAADLPERALADAGVDVEAIRTLRDRASDLGGQEVAEIARSIAGPAVGRAPDHAGHPADRGPPGSADGTPGGSNTTERTDDDDSRGPSGERSDGTTATETSPGDGGNATAGQGSGSTERTGASHGDGA